MRSFENQDVLTIFFFFVQFISLVGNNTKKKNGIKSNGYLVGNGVNWEKGRIKFMIFYIL